MPKRGPRRFLPRTEKAPQDRIPRLKLSSLFGKGDTNGAEERAVEPEDGGAAVGAIKAPIVVGLGNPGRSYSRTRHNIGFLVVDELASRYGGDWRTKKKTEAAPVSIGAANATLLKPTTYMNNSGVVLPGYKLEQLIAIHDDLDLPAGDVRVKVGGGHGGHNGLRSIFEHLGKDFVRVRVGIGRPPVGVAPVDYVLGRMDSAVRDAVPRAADAVEAVIEKGPEAAMNHFNTRA